MDNEMLEQFQMIMGAIGALDAKVDALDKKVNTLDGKVSIVRADIEHKVTKRLDSLTDGYMLTHEKQFELERRMDILEKKLEELSGHIA